MRIKAVFLCVLLTAMLAACHMPGSPGAARAPLQAHFIDVGDGDWGPQAVVRGDQRLPLAAPSSGPWAATLQRRQG